MDMFLNGLRDEVYADAVAHGLWDEELSTHDCIELIIDEVCEAEDAVLEGREEHFHEELADVLIMTLSVCGKLGIDIDAEVRRKMDINKKRPYGHKGEKRDDD